jgi:hypothetical protein
MAQNDLIVVGIDVVKDKVHACIAISIVVMCCSSSRI